jgi:uncharacterized membrane protein
MFFSDDLREGMTMTRALPFLTLLSVLGCGLISGVFFAFSSFVMPALARLPPMQGVAAMQSINIAVINRWFLGAFLGTAALCLLLAVGSVITWSRPGAALRLGGCLLYLVGAIVVTAAFNIPRNDALAALPADSLEAANLWPRYVAEWSAWNHVRAAAPLLAAALLMLAEIVYPRS